MSYCWQPDPLLSAGHVAAAAAAAVAAAAVAAAAVAAAAAGLVSEFEIVYAHFRIVDAVPWRYSWGQVLRGLLE